MTWPPATYEVIYRNPFTPTASNRTYVKMWSYAYSYWKRRVLMKKAFWKISRDKPYFFGGGTLPPYVRGLTLRSRYKLVLPPWFKGGGGGAWWTLLGILLPWETWDQGRRKNGHCVVFCSKVGIILKTNRKKITVDKYRMIELNSTLPFVGIWQFLLFYQRRTLCGLASTRPFTPED